MHAVDRAMRAGDGHIVCKQVRRLLSHNGHTNDASYTSLCAHFLPPQGVRRGVNNSHRTMHLLIIGVLRWSSTTVQMYKTVALSGDFHSIRLQVFTDEMTLAWSIFRLPAAAESGAN